MTACVFSLYPSRELQLNVKPGQRVAFWGSNEVQRFVDITSPYSRPSTHVEYLAGMKGVIDRLKIQYLARGQSYCCAVFRQRGGIIFLGFCAPAVFSLKRILEIGSANARRASQPAPHFVSHRHPGERRDELAGDDRFDRLERA